MKVKKVKLLVTREYEVRVYGDFDFKKVKEDIAADIKSGATACSCSRYGFDIGNLVEIKEVQK